MRTFLELMKRKLLFAIINACYNLTRHTIISFYFCSNLGYAILAHALFGKFGGRYQNWQQWIQHEVLYPLGMTRTVLNNYNRYSMILVFNFVNIIYSQLALCIWLIQVSLIRILLHVSLIKEHGRTGPVLLGGRPYDRFLPAWVMLLACSQVLRLMWLSEIVLFVGEVMSYIFPKITSTAQNLFVTSATH
jgi:hypothetical protein